MILIYNHVCANCNQTLKHCGMKKFNIHHTRYDVDQMDSEFTRFFCNSCNKLDDFSAMNIIEGQIQNPLTKRRKVSDSDPSTFRKGVQIQILLEEYAEIRISDLEEKKKNPRLIWEEFRADASNYCDCMPKTITEHIPRLVSKSLGRFRFYESPSSGKKYLMRRLIHEDNEE